MRASASSLRNCLFSASSSAAESAPGAALRFLGDRSRVSQLPNVPLGIERRFAAVSCDSPCSVTSLVASARNSGVYFYLFIGFSLSVV